MDYMFELRDLLVDHYPALFREIQGKNVANPEVLAKLNEITGLSLQSANFTPSVSKTSSHYYTACEKKRKKLVKMIHEEFIRVQKDETRYSHYLMRYEL